MHLNRLSFFFATLLMFISEHTAASANLVKNGGFETGDFTGWSSDRQWSVSNRTDLGGYVAQGIADLGYHGHLS